MSESSKRHSKFLSLIFILKCLSKASVITNRLPNRYFPKTDLGAPVQFSANERRKYSKKRKSWNLWTSSWIRTEKNPPTFRGDQQSSFKNRFSLARLLACLLACESGICGSRWLTLIINIQRFDWISTVSRKVLTLARTSAPWGFEVSVATKYN